MIILFRCKGDKQIGFVIKKRTQCQCMAWPFFIERASNHLKLSQWRPLCYIYKRGPIGYQSTYLDRLRQRW